MGGMGTTGTAGTTGTTGEAARNEVVLVGRVSGAAEDRELPSGDVLTTFRVVVDRPPLRRSPPEGVRPPTVDTLDCVAWTAATRRRAQSLGPGDLVSVEGALRRRFWRTPGGPASRYEVEVLALRRLTPA